MVGDLLLGDAVLLAQFLVSGEVRLRLGEQALVVGERPFRLVERRLIGARIDLGEKVALLDDLAFLEADSINCPLIWVCTVIVASGVTVPRPESVSSISPTTTLAAPTVWISEGARV